MIPQVLQPIPTSKLGRLIHNKDCLLITKSTGIKDENKFDDYFLALHQDDYKLQEEMNDPIVFMSKHNKEKDIMYYHQEIVAHDKSTSLMPLSRNSMITQSKSTGRLYTRSPFHKAPKYYRQYGQ